MRGCWRLIRRDDPGYHAAMLPESFQWIPRWQYDDGELALALDGDQIAMLMRRADGGWVARLEAQQPLSAPLVMRQCTSFEAGKAGIEAWAIRHEARIRDEVARKVWRVER